MKGKLFVSALLLLLGSYANASSVLVGNGISWTTTVEGAGTTSGFITLQADTSGASFGWGDTGYLAGLGIKDLGGEFNITDISLTNWVANGHELSGSGLCTAGKDQSSRSCIYSPSIDDRISSDSNLTIVLGIEMTSGVIDDGFHFKARWENLEGDKTGSLISDDFSAVPLPAAAWLFGSALMGLTVIARRKDLRNRAHVA